MLSAFPADSSAVPPLATAPAAPVAAGALLSAADAPSESALPGDFADFLDALSVDCTRIEDVPAVPPAPGSAEAQPPVVVTGQRIALPPPMPARSWQFTAPAVTPPSGEPAVTKDVLPDMGDDIVFGIIDLPARDAEELPVAAKAEAPDWVPAFVLHAPTPPPLPTPALPATPTTSPTTSPIAVDAPAPEGVSASQKPMRSTVVSTTAAAAPERIMPAVKPTAPAAASVPAAVDAPAIAPMIPFPGLAVQGRVAVESPSREIITAASPAPAASPSAQPAQISTPPPAPSPNQENNGGSKNKNTSQNHESKRDMETVFGAGTARAYEQASMSSSTATFAPAASVVVRDAAAPELIATPASAAAVKLVERVAEAAEHLASRPSEPISLSIQLDDTHRVDVRVSMREGRVHTAFSSDSPEVRSALSAAWDGFVRGRDGAEQRWAEPVFTAAGSTPVAPSLHAAAPVSDVRADSGLAGSGHDQSRRQAPESRPEHASSGRSRTGGFSVAPSTSIQPAAPRPDTSRHLSAVA